MSSRVDFGLGLRPEHYEEIVASPGKVSWFEALSENYMVKGGMPLYWLDRIRRDYPMALHGVSLSIGTTDPLDTAYLDELKALADRVQPMWVSDHLCFTGLRGLNMHDLLPLPYTEEAVATVVRNVRRVQDYLERPLLLENVSSYLSFEADSFQEWDFVAAVAEFLYRITEPVLRPIRSFLPNLGGIDISPIILFLIIILIERVIIYYIYPNVI